MAVAGVFLSTIWLRKRKKTSFGNCLDLLEPCKTSRLFATCKQTSVKALDLSPWPTTMRVWWPFSHLMAILWATESFRSALRPTIANLKNHGCAILPTPQNHGCAILPLRWNGGSSNVWWDNEAGWMMYFYYILPRMTKNPPTTIDIPLNNPYKILHRIF